MIECHHLGSHSHFQFVKLLRGPTPILGRGKLHIPPSELWSILLPSIWEVVVLEAFGK